MPRQGIQRISAPLSNLSQRYDNFQYIASDVLKDIMVANESGSYWIYNNDQRMEYTIRENGAQANQMTFDMSTSTFRLSEHAVKDIITDRDRTHVEAPIQLDRDTTEYLTDKILLRQEFETHQLLFTTTTFSNNVTLTSASSWKIHTTSSAPIQDVLSATAYIMKNAGVRPNTMVMSIDVLNALKENTNVHERIKYVQKSIMSEDLLASVFDMQKIHVGSAIRDTVDEGLTASKSDIWGDDCLVAWFDPNPGLKTKTAAANFRLAGRGIPWRVKKYRKEDVEGDVVEVQSFFKPRPISTASGYLLKAVSL